MAMMKRRLTDLLITLSDEVGMEPDALMEMWEYYCFTCEKKGERANPMDFYDMVVDGDL